MVTVKIDTQVLNDMHKLLSELKTFMTLNMVHLDQNAQGDAKIKLKEMVEYCNRNYSNLDIFKLPLMNYSKENTQILKRNFTTLIKYIYDFLSYAEPILKAYRADIYNGRFKTIKKEYTDFSIKYLK